MPIEEGNYLFQYAYGLRLTKPCHVGITGLLKGNGDELRRGHLLSLYYNLQYMKSYNSTLFVPLNICSLRFFKDL